MLSTMSRTFTAQELREALSTYGFVPIYKFVNTEHWVRGSKNVKLSYEGDFPGSVPADSLEGAYAVDREHFIELSFA